MNTHNHHEPAPSVLQAGLFWRCPRCGKGKLFKGFLDTPDRCDQCGLDFGFADSGDGPAIFTMLLVGFIVVGGALWMEISYQPPYWIHAVIWGPLAIILPLLILRPIKALLIAQQYKKQALEGRLEVKKTGK